MSVRSRPTLGFLPAFPRGWGFWRGGALVARHPHKVKVAGSIPAPAPIFVEQFNDNLLEHVESPWRPEWATDWNSSDEDLLQEVRAVIDVVGEPDYSRCRGLGSQRGRGATVSTPGFHPDDPGSIPGGPTTSDAHEARPPLPSSGNPFVE